VGAGATQASLVSIGGIATVTAGGALDSGSETSAPLEPGAVPSPWRPIARVARTPMPRATTATMSISRHAESLFAVPPVDESPAPVGEI
jgi:hypothetical protein